MKTYGDGGSDGMEVLDGGGADPLPLDGGGDPIEPGLILTCDGGHQGGAPGTWLTGTTTTLVDAKIDGQPRTHEVDAGNDAIITYSYEQRAQIEIQTYSNTYDSELDLTRVCATSPTYLRLDPTRVEVAYPGTHSVALTLSDTKHGRTGTETVVVDVPRTGEELSPKPGTLLHALTPDATYMRLVPSDVAGTQKVYSTQDHTNSIYVRNVNRIFPSLDLTGASPWNSTEGRRRAGTAITQRHIAYANHYPLGNGATVRFITADGQVIERQTSNQTRISGDLMVATLDSDLPTSITPFSVLPADWADYMGGRELKLVPFLALDQEEKLLLAEANGLLIRFMTNPVFAPYNELLVDGDSGNPAFFSRRWASIPILAYTFHSSSSGTHLDQHLSSLQSYCGAYPLNIVDLSSFTKFN